MKKKICILFASFLSVWIFNVVGQPVGTCTTGGQFLPDSYSCFVYYECLDEGGILMPTYQECDKGITMHEFRWGVIIIPPCWNQNTAQCTYEYEACYCYNN